MTDTQILVKSLYKDEKGNPLELTASQDQLFSAIARKSTRRLQVMSHTRWGKSMTVGLAVLTRASTYPGKWALIAPTRDKAKIIMDYVIAHIFDNDFTVSRFMPEKGESLIDIRRHRNKSRLTFKVGEKIGENGRVEPLFGDVFIGTAKDALGFGAENVIEDESALIEDDDHSLVMRMLGDNPDSNFLCKIGNPFARNHFLKSYHDPKYVKLVVDCYQSLKEGRMTQEIIDENKDYSFFKVLFECKFPSASEIDESGWMSLLLDEDIDIAQQRKQDTMGVPKLGLDVARGGRNYNVWVKRTDNVAEIIERNLESNLINVGDKTKELMDKHGIRASEVYIDDGGVGGGVTDYLRSNNIPINAINFGSSASDEEMYNTRAEMYAGKEGLAVWIKSGGLLVPNANWIELTRIKYKKSLNGKTQIEPKEQMRKRGVESPDVADALALTFANQTKEVYYGINVQKILESNQSAGMFGGVERFPNMPG